MRGWKVGVSGLAVLIVLALVGSLHGQAPSSAPVTAASASSATAGGVPNSQASDTYWPERIIAGATVIYSIIAIFQWIALRATVEENKKLIETANRQAGAAEKQVENLEKTLVGCVATFVGVAGNLKTP